MKTILLSVIASLFLLTANSCKQCTLCTNYPQPDVELCKKDYASTESYNEAFRQTTGAGYDCE